VALTPAAVGQRIRQLEDQVGAKLFHRTSRTCVLTQEGLALLPHAQATLELAGNCMRAARGETAPPQFELVLGTRHELGLSWIVPMLPAIRNAHPGLKVHLYFGSGVDLLIRVRTLEIHAAIGSMRSFDPRIGSERLHPEEYVFVGQKQLLRKQQLLDADHAIAHTLIDTSSELPLFGYWRDARGAPVLKFGSVLHMGTIAAVHRLVRDGEGVAVLPRYLIADDLRSKRLKVLFPAVKPGLDHFRLFFRVDDPRRSLYEALATTMRQHPLR
jgi:DNA-binding transcriptional LysR family regulator